MQCQTYTRHFAVFREMNGGGSGGRDFSSDFFFSVRDGGVAIPTLPTRLYCPPSSTSSSSLVNHTKSLFKGRPWHWNIDFYSGRFYSPDISWFFFVKIVYSLLCHENRRIVFRSLPVRLEMSRFLCRKPLTIDSNQLSWIWNCRRSNGPARRTALLFWIQTNHGRRFPFDRHFAGFSTFA